MAVKIELSHSEEELIDILTYEYANREDRPNLSAAEIRQAVAKHYREVSRSVIMGLTKERIDNTEYWAKRVVKGKGFHFKPRHRNWPR